MSTRSVPPCLGSGFSPITLNYSPGDLTSRISPWFRRTSNSLAITCSSSSSTTNGLRPMISPSALRSTTSQPTEVGQVPRPERLQGLGLYVPRSTGLSLFIPGPPLERRAGTHNRRSNPSGCAIFRSNISTRRFRPL